MDDDVSIMLSDLKHCGVVLWKYCHGDRMMVCETASVSQRERCRASELSI